MNEIPQQIRDDPRIAALWQIRESDAAKARTARKRYHSYSLALIITSTLSAILGGLVLYGVEASEESSMFLAQLVAKDSVRRTLLVLNALMLGLTAYFGYVVREEKSGEAHVDCRMQAENGRLEIARSVLEIGHEKGIEVFVLAGRWFLGFLDEQERYLNKAANKHQKNAGVLIIVLAGLTAISAFAGALAGITDSMFVVLIAIFGICTPAMVAGVKTWNETTSDAKRAKIHEISWREMMLLNRDRAEFETAIAQNDLDAAMNFADKFFDALRRDHVSFQSIRKNGEEHSIS